MGQCMQMTGQGGNAIGVQLVDPRGLDGLSVIDVEESRTLVDPLISEDTVPILEMHRQIVGVLGAGAHESDVVDVGQGCVVTGNVVGLCGVPTVGLSTTGPTALPFDLIGACSLGDDQTRPALGVADSRLNKENTGSPHTRRLAGEFSGLQFL